MQGRRFVLVWSVLLVCVFALIYPECCQRHTSGRIRMRSKWDGVRRWHASFLVPFLFNKPPAAPEKAASFSGAKAWNALSDDVKAHVCCDNPRDLVYSPRVAQPHSWGNEQKPLQDKRGVALGTQYIMPTYGSAQSSWTFSTTCAFFVFLLLLFFILYNVHICVCAWHKFLRELLQAVTSSLSAYWRVN